MAEIVGLAGFPPREVWQHMTWRDYVDLSRQWRQWPPLVVSCAVAAGMAPQQREGQESDQSAIDTLTQFIGAPPPNASP